MDVSKSISNLIPTPPNEGPPLPEGLAPYLPFKGYWPWYKPSAPAATTFTITATVSGSGGTVSPSSVTVISGNDDSITILPGSGYQIDTITDNGAPVANPASPYIISNVTADHAVVVTFAAIPVGATGPTEQPATTYTVTVTVSGGNGTVSPATQVEKSGDSASITILPSSGYEINTIVDNGVMVTGTNPYVIDNVTADHAVVVTFVKSVAAVSGLTITSAGTQAAVGGGLQLSATVKQADGTITDVTDSRFIVWQSSNPAVATISSLASLNAVAVGTTVVSATYNDGMNNLTSNQITITVVAAVVYTPTFGNIGGTVTDASTGLPITGVTVTTFGQTATTDINGIYNISGIPAGGYSVTFTKAGYTTQTQTAAVGEGYPYELNVSLSTVTVAIHPSIIVSPSTMRAYIDNLTVKMLGFQYDSTGVMNTYHNVTQYGVTYSAPVHVFPAWNNLAVFLDNSELGQTPMNPDGSGSLSFSYLPPGDHIIMVTDIYGNSASASLTVLYP